MKIATLYRKDGKVILETDNDAIAQVATDTPQDVVVMDAYHFTGERQVGRPAALAAPYGQNVPPHGMAGIGEVRERLASISGVAGARVSAESDDIRALLADHARLQCKNDELSGAVRGLLDALPSATTHPAIAAARKAVQS